MPLPNGSSRSSPKPSKPNNAKPHPKPPLPSARPLLPPPPPATTTLQRPRKSLLRRQSAVELSTTASPSVVHASKPSNKRVSFGGANVKLFSPSEQSSSGHSTPETEQPPHKSQKLSLFGTAGSSFGPSGIRPKGSPRPTGRNFELSLDSDSDDDNVGLPSRIEDDVGSESSVEPSPNKALFLPKQVYSPARCLDDASSDRVSNLRKAYSGSERPQTAQIFSEGLSPLPPSRTYNRPSELGCTYQVLRETDLSGENAADNAMREDYTLNLSELDGNLDHGRRRSSLSSIGDDDEPTLNACDIAMLQAEDENYNNVHGIVNPTIPTSAQNEDNQAQDEGDMTLPPFGPGSLLERQMGPSPDRKFDEGGDISLTVGEESSGRKTVVRTLLNDAETEEEDRIDRDNHDKATSGSGKRQQTVEQRMVDQRRQSSIESVPDSDRTIRNLYESTLHEEDPTLHWTPENPGKASEQSANDNGARSRISLAPVLSSAGTPRSVNGEESGSGRIAAPSESTPAGSSANIRISLAPVQRRGTSSCDSTLEIAGGNNRRSPRISLASLGGNNGRSPRISLAPVSSVNVRGQTAVSGAESEASIPMSDNLSLMPAASIKNSRQRPNDRRRLNEDTSRPEPGGSAPSPSPNQNMGMDKTAPPSTEFHNISSLLMLDESAEHRTTSSHHSDISLPSRSPNPVRGMNRSEMAPQNTGRVEQPGNQPTAIFDPLEIPQSSPSVSLSLQDGKILGTPGSEMISGAMPRKGNLRKQFGIEGGGSATPSVEINPSALIGVGTSSRAVREDIYSTSTFKQQLASRSIQFDLSEPKRNVSQVGVRTEMSESESRAQPFGPGDVNQETKNRFLDETRKKAMHSLLKEVIKHLRNKLDRSKMAVQRNEAELERVKPKMFRRVCNPELFSSADEATMLMVDLKRTRKASYVQACRKWKESRGEWEQGFVDSLRQVKMEIRQDVSKIRQATAQLTKTSEDLHKSGAIDREYIDRELINTQVDTTRDYMVQLASSLGVRHAEVDSKLMEEQEKRRELARLRTADEELDQLLDYWKVYGDVDTVSKSKKLTIEYEEFNSIVSSISGIQVIEKGHCHFTVQVAGMMNVQVSVNKDHLINAKCWPVNVAADKQSVWQQYVDGATDIAIETSQISQNESTRNLPATLGVAAGFLQRARYAFEQAKEFEMLNSGELIFAGIVPQESEQANLSQEGDENVAPESASWSATAVHVVLKAPFLCMRRRSRFDVQATHEVRVEGIDDPCLTRTVQNLRVDKIVRHFGEEPSDEEIRSLVEGYAHYPGRVVSLNSGLGCLWKVLHVD